MSEGSQELEVGAALEFKSSPLWEPWQCQISGSIWNGRHVKNRISKTGHICARISLQGLVQFPECKLSQEGQSGEDVPLKSSSLAVVEYCMHSMLSSCELAMLIKDTRAAHSSSNDSM